MTPIARLRAKLARHPELAVRDEGERITVPARSPDGFDVAFAADADGCTICFGPWHEHFEAAEVESALCCFAFGLSGQARLRVESRGGVDCKWTLEVLEAGEWKTHSETGLLFYPFWARRSIRHLRNGG